jgi:hypothetical protein
MDAVSLAARSIKAGEAELMIAGGVESMSRAPFVLGKATSAFSRNAELFDTTIGWRFVNPLIKAQYGIDSMPETAENVAAEFQVSRADQDRFALASQMKASAASHSGAFSTELVAVPIRGKAGVTLVERDADTVSRGRQRDRGQRVGRERRRMRAAARLRRGRQAPWPDASRARHRLRSCRRATTHHGHRACSGHAEVAREDRREAR